jgi:cyclin-dependent kinase
MLTPSCKAEYEALWRGQLEAILAQAVTTLASVSSMDEYREAEDTPLEQIGPYQARHHASGITSTVYRSRLAADGTFIAIKVTTPHLLVQPHNAHREARLLQMATHGAVVPLISTEKAPGGHFLLTFPFLPHDLESLLHNRSLTRHQTTKHLQSLFAALEHVHSLGVVHRDIKPSNLLLKTLDGPAYLADFGIAWHKGDPDSEPWDEKITDVGTTCYRPPELMFGNKSYGEKLDIWAAGCVVAEAFHGKSLFDAGELGSDLALIRSIFMTLGTPDDETWPVSQVSRWSPNDGKADQNLKEAKHFRDWGKIQFAEYPRRPWHSVLPSVAEPARDLVASLVQYQSSDRLSASDV